MKKLLIVLLFIPAVVSGRRLELGLAYGQDIAIEGSNDIYAFYGGGKGCVSALVNLNKMQVGGGVEFGPHSFDDGFMMLKGIINHKFLFRRLYLYAGLSGGWIRFTNFYPGGSTGALNYDSNGFFGGIQTGTVVYLSRHFGLSAEVGYRHYSKHYEGKYDKHANALYGGPFNVDESYMCGSIGLRYRF